MVETYAYINGTLAQGGGTVVPQLDSAERDTWIQLEAFPDSNNGFVFSHWNSKIPDQSSIKNSFTKVTEVTALFTVPKITFEAHFYNTYSLTLTTSLGGEVVDSFLQGLKHGIDTQIIARADRRYVFSHWSVTTGGSGIVLSDPFSAKTSAVLSGNAEINAHFNPLAKLTIVDSSGMFIDSLFIPQNVPTVINTPLKRNDLKNIEWVTQSGMVTIDGTHSFNPSVTLQNDAVIAVQYDLKSLYPITSQPVSYEWSTHGFVEDSTQSEMIAFYIEGIGKPMRIKAEGGGGDLMSLAYYKNDRLFNQQFRVSPQGDSVEFEIPIVQNGEWVYIALFRPQQSSFIDSVTLSYEVGNSVVVDSKQGTIQPSSTFSMFDGDTASLKAFPYLGYIFKHWIIDSTTTHLRGLPENDSISIAIQSDALLQAVYNTDTTVQPYIFIKEVNSYHFPDICFDFTIIDSLTGQIIPQVDSDRLKVWQAHSDSSQIETRQTRINEFRVTQTREKRSVLFAIDESHSMAPYILSLQEELYYYVLHMDRLSQVGILGFDGGINEYAPVTADTTLLNKAVAELSTTLNNKTNTIDGVYAAIESLKGNVGEKVIYIIADGSGSVNLHHISDIRDSAVKYDIALYAFWLEHSMGTVWDSVAPLTGGAVIKNIPRNSLFNQLSLIENSLYNDYRLCYRSPDTLSNGDRYNISLETVLSVSGQEGKDTTEWIENDKNLSVTLTSATDSLLRSSVPVWQNILIGVHISSGEPIVSAQLFYRTTGSIFYDVIELQLQSGELFEATIPYYSAVKPGVDFYVAVSTLDNQNVYAPYTKLGYPVQRYPYYIAIENSPPTVVTNVKNCYVRGANEFLISGSVVDPEGVTSLELRYQFDQSPLLQSRLVNIQSDGSFNYSISLHDSLPLEYQFTSRDGYSAQGNYPLSGFMRHEQCPTIASPVATLLNAEQGSSTLFNDSAQIYFSLNGYSIDDSVEIQYTILGVDSLEDSNLIIFPGDTLTLNSAGTLYFYSLSSSNRYSPSAIDSIVFYQISKLAKPTINTSSILQGDTFLYKDSLFILSWSIDSLVDSATIFAELLDSTGQWSALPFHGLELNKRFNTSLMGTARFYMKAPLLLPSDTLTFILHQIPDTIPGGDPIVVPDLIPQGGSSQEEDLVSSHYENESSSSEKGVTFTSWIIDRNGDGAGETVYIKTIDGMFTFSAVTPAILFYKGSDSARTIVPYSIKKDASGMRLDLSTEQSELVFESSLQQSPLYLQVPPEWNSIGAVQFVVINDSVSPIITGVERIPGQGKHEGIEKIKRWDHFIFRFSKPMNTTTMNTEVFNESFYFNETCNTQPDSHEQKPLKFMSISPLDSSNSQWYVRFDDGVEPLVGGCIGIKATQSIRDVNGNSILKQLVKVNGIQRNGVLEIGIFPSVLSLSGELDEPTEFYEEMPVDSLRGGQFGLTLACDSSFSSEVYIYTMQGTFVHHMSYSYVNDSLDLHHERGNYGAMHYLFWNVRGQDARKVGTGVYIWRVIIRYGSGMRERYMLKSGLIR